MLKVVFKIENGVDIRDLPREELRSMFGMVLQDTWLYSGTIYDNIRYGRLDARKDEIINAAKIANVHHFIRTLPDGYNSHINEEANNIFARGETIINDCPSNLKRSSNLDS